MSGRSAPWVRLWARDGLTVAATQFAALAVTTLLAVIVARYLGPSEFGVFAGFLGLSQVLMLFAGFGVSTWLLRELSNAVATSSPDAGVLASRWLSAAAAIALFLSAAFALVAFAVSQAVGSSGELGLALVALMAYTGLLGVSTILEVTFRAHRRLSRIVVATLLEKLSLAGMVLLAVASEAGIAGIAAAYTIAGALRVGWVLRTLYSGRFGALVRPTLRDAGAVVGWSLPFGLGTALPTAVVRCDVFLIGLFSTATAGMYAIADRFLGVLLVIPATFSSALYPHLARHADPLRASRRAAAGFGLVGVLLAAGGVLIAAPAVSILFGSEYEAATDGVRIMLLAAPLMFAASVLMTGMFSDGHERPVLVVMLVCNTAGTGFVLAGQQASGLEGAAAGYVCRNVVLLVALTALSVALRRRTGPPPATTGDLRADGTVEPVPSFPLTEGRAS